MDQFDITTLPVSTTLHWSESFASWLHNSGRKPLTIAAYLQDMHHYFRYFGEINAVNVKAYFAMQDVDNTVKPTSRNRRLASIKVFVRWAVDAGIMDADPTIGIKRMEIELSPRDRTPDEMAALRTVAQSSTHLKCHTENHSLLGLRDQLIWNLFELTGMRIHEIAGLKIQDVDPNEMIIHVLGKGGKKAPVKMSHRLWEVIASWLDRMPATVEGYLVTDWSGNGVSTGQIRRRIQMMGESAGVSDLKPHDLRHTRAYALLDQLRAQGIPDPVALDGVRKELRHGDTRTTQQFYLRVRDSHLRAAVEAM